MAEETTTEPVASASVPEPALVQPEPEIITPPAPEPTAEPVVVEETPTAQLVEPLDPEPILEPPLAPEPVQEPVIETPPTDPNLEPESVSQSEPQPIPESIPTPPVQTSTPPVIQTSLARELLIKAREAIQFRKRKKLEKIMGLFLKKQSITNDDVQKLLYVSDATATRYLKQLENDGRIRRQGSIGHISYSRI